jgi:hypothetical protein
MRRLVLTMAVTLLGAAAAFADDIVVPLAAWNAPGAYGNLWSTEVYLVNPQLQDLQVSAARLMPLSFIMPTTCEPANTPWVVPAKSSVLLSAAELDRSLGCPLEYVGGLVFTADPGIVIQTRMVNHKAEGPVSGEGLLSGFGSEIPGLETTALAQSFIPPMLPAPVWPYVLPALVWDGSAPAAFDTYVYIANPNSTDAEVTLGVSAGGQPASMLLEGTEVSRPYTIIVPAGRTIQLHPMPTSSGAADAGEGPALFDLSFYVSADGPIAVVGTVVDRASNDARVVLPVQAVGTQ